MNYYGPRKREFDGRFDYTCMNDGRIWPVGYCAKWREPIGDFWTEKAKAEYTATKDKHHTDGHATEKAACECYRQYILDHEVRYDGEDTNQQRKCKICGEWTTKFACTNYAVFHLCEKHCNRDGVEKLIDAAGWSISS